MLFASAVDVCTLPSSCSFQCHKFHELEAFDVNRHSCRAKLQKRVAAQQAASAAGAASGAQGKAGSMDSPDTGSDEKRTVGRRRVGKGPKSGGPEGGMSVRMDGMPPEDSRDYSEYPGSAKPDGPRVNPSLFHEPPGPSGAFSAVSPASGSPHPSGGFPQLPMSSMAQPQQRFPNFPRVDLTQLRAMSGLGMDRVQAMQSLGGQRVELTKARHSWEDQQQLERPSGVAAPEMFNILSHEPQAQFESYEEQLQLFERGQALMMMEEAKKRLGARGMAARSLPEQMQLQQRTGLMLTSSGGFSRMAMWHDCPNDGIGCDQAVAQTDRPCPAPHAPPLQAAGASMPYHVQGQPRQQWPEPALGMPVRLRAGAPMAELFDNRPRRSSWLPDWIEV